MSSLLSEFRRLHDLGSLGCQFTITEIVGATGGPLVMGIRKRLPSRLTA